MDEEDGFEEIRKANQLAKGDTLDESGGEKSQEEEYEDDFDQRYRQRSKAYERMDEINKLKKPIKAGREQIRRGLDPEKAMRAQVDEFFEECQTDSRGLLPTEEAQRCILEFTEQILGYEPHEE